MPRTTRVNSSLLFVRRACLRWKPAVGVSVTSFFLIVAFTLLLPNTYRSRLNVVVGQVGADFRTFGLPYPPGSSAVPQINSEIQRLTSDDILHKVILQSHLAGSSGLSDSASLKREAVALRHLHEDLAVTAFQGPDVVEITYEASSPERASDVLRNIASAYANTYRIIPVVPASALRLRKMAASNHARLAAARTELARFVKVHRVPTISSNLDQAAVELTEAEDATQRTLIRRVTDLQSLDQAFRTRIAEARLVERLDAQSVSSLGTMEPSQPQLVSAPPRGLMVLCGLLASLLLGVATAFALERLSDRLDSRSSVEEATGIPVLAAIPPNAVAPAYHDAFPALYLAMQRPVSVFEGKLS